VYAVSGIGNPERFFKTLDGLAVTADTQAFDDHHQFCEQDFVQAAGRPVLMTAKDAVKCHAFAAENWWYLSVEAQFDETFTRSIDHFLTTAVKK
jgi:tetraacyldisaccharide 4'-kinase